MKPTAKIFLCLSVVLTGVITAANIAIKKGYEDTDVSDPYWTYGKILEQPFDYIDIKGGNATRIAFSRSADASVRVLREWPGFANRSVKASVRSDTLFLTIPDIDPGNPKLRDWFRNTTLVWILSPRLALIRGVDTRLKLDDFQQKDLVVFLSGRSELTLESDLPAMDRLVVNARDSSTINFGWEKQDTPFTIHSVSLNAQGASRVDLGSARVDSLQLELGDSAIVELSGTALKHRR